MKRDGGMTHSGPEGVVVVRWALSLLRRRRARAPERGVSWGALGVAAGTLAVAVGLVVAKRRWGKWVAEPDAAPEPVPTRQPAPILEPVDRFLQPRRARRVLPALRTFTVLLVAGGLGLGACVAAMIPGARIIAAGHHFTAEEVRGNFSVLSQRTTVLDAAGGEIGRLGLEDREPVQLGEVPDMVVDAVIATEDQSFWENPGIDLGSVFRAFVTNASAGEIEQGGSTITQQLVKNRLYRANRDLDRKIRELVLAYRVNQEFTKEEILEEYLNTVYFGQGAYGIRTAAERFFVVAEPPFGATRGKQLDELNLADAALLAGVIANPEGDNPFAFPARALNRRADTLEEMVDQGHITRPEADFASASPLPTVVPPAELRPQNYFVEEVQHRLLADPRLGATEAERLELLLRGGLDVQTTLDPVAQLNAQQAVNANLPDNPPFTGALVAVEPETGAVRAMVGGPGFEQLQYNIVTQPPGRQAGSAWKVITLAAALEAGYSPNDVVDGTSPCTIQHPFYGRYDTVNAEPHSGGPMTIREATIGSVNCAYVRVLSSFGPQHAIDVAYRLGIQQQSLQPYLSITLGTIEATPLEMATIGATIAAEGVRRDPYFVQRVTRPDGTVLIDETDRPGIQAIVPEVAACALDLLQGVVTGGTGAAARLPDRAAAGKTGTTDNKADAWFLGVTPQLSAAVWHGASTGAVPGAGFGGEIPARIWRAFMSAQLAGQPQVPFPAPGPGCNAPGYAVLDTGRVHPWVLVQLYELYLSQLGQVPPLPPGTPPPPPGTPPPPPGAPPPAP